MTSETKHNPIFCILNCPNDASSKQLTISAKNVFPQNHLLCSMKTAVDLATKGKTPFIKLPSTDLSTIPGNLVSLIVSNWISTQLKKPPPKAGAKKAPPKKAGKGNTAAPTTAEETPHPPENENQLPTFIYLSEYPKTIDQMKQLCASSSPVICYIYIDYNPTTAPPAPAAPETSHKGNQQASTPPPIDWQEHFSSELPFISINLISENQNPDEALADLVKNVTTTYDRFQKYRVAFQDYRFISIPTYPKEPLIVPQVAQEKVGKQAASSGKGKDNQPASIAAQLTQVDTTKFGGPGGPEIHTYLQKAFKTTLIKQLNSYLERAICTNYSPDFQHAAEILPNYPLPAYLALILAHKASTRVPELFTMRSLAYRTKMDLQMIENTLVINKFEELIGYSVGERRHVESIPVEFVPNVLAPLLPFYGSFKWTDYAGKILLAFFNPIPDEFPLSTVEESFKLPLAQGFGSWSSTQSSESDLPQEDNKEADSQPNDDSQNSEKIDQNPEQTDQTQDKAQDQTQDQASEQTQNEGENQNTNSKHYESIGINVGKNDSFLDFDSNVTTSSITRYFCESGLRIETTPPVIIDDLLSSLYFSVTYGSNTGPKFSFNISQNHIDVENTNKNEEEEDEEENIETKVTIRSVLGIETQCYLDFSFEEQSITLMMKNSTVVFDINNGRTIVTRTSIDKSVKTAELKRIITFKGDVIRYLSNGSIIIYKTDGSIQTCLPNKEWHLVDANGHAYVKKDGQWFKDSQHDETSEVADTYFIPRKVTNWSHGVSFIEDNDELTILFSDKTKYIQKNGSFIHPDLPEIRVFDQVITVETSEYVATFSGETRDCTLELKNNNISIDYKKESSHLLIQYGQFKKIMSMIDLYTGIVAHAGLNRCVYYLNDDYKWEIGRQNCSKKEILQHFQDNDFTKTLTPVEKFDHDSELLPIIANGHKPRLFIVERDRSDSIASLSVQELLAASDFQSIMESSTTRISKKEDCKVTLWFDTEPKSYREITITPKITDEQKNSVFEGMEEQKEIEAKRFAILDSVSDPKWARIDSEQRKEEEDVQALLRKYSSNNGESTD